MYSIRTCTHVPHPYPAPLTSALLHPTPPQDNSTFFLNTIPIRKRTYAIHSSWASEGIHQQRMDRQRKDMANSTRDNCGKRKFPYRTTDYSFIY